MVSLYDMRMTPTTRRMGSNMNVEFRPCWLPTNNVVVTSHLRTTIYAGQELVYRKHTNYKSTDDVNIILSGRTDHELT